jgi:hypothetical protein
VMNPDVMTVADEMTTGELARYLTERKIFIVPWRLASDHSESAKDDRRERRSLTSAPSLPVLEAGYKPASSVAKNMAIPPPRSSRPTIAARRM